MGAGNAFELVVGNRRVSVDPESGLIRMKDAGKETILPLQVAAGSAIGDFFESDVNLAQTERDEFGEF